MAEYYVVRNFTNHTIWWRDGGWYSGDLEAGKSRRQEADHDADVTMYEKVSSRDREWGRVWILLGTTLEVHGEREWCLKPKLEE